MSIHRLKVLIVEDDMNVRATIHGMLQEMGVSEILEATDGNEASALIELRSEEISLVICDWNMPNKTGINVLADARVHHPDLPFLMVTARADHRSVTEARDLGVTGYICKPFTFDIFKSKINYIVKK